MTVKPAEDDEYVRLLAQISDDAPVSILVHDFDGTILYANEETFRLYGYTRGEFLKKNLHGIDVPESGHLFAERMQQVKMNGEAGFEVRHFRKDGSIIPLHVRVKTMDWGGRNVLLSIATDLLGCNLSEEAQWESEIKFYDLLENAGDLIQSVKPDGSFIYTNHTWSKTLGYTEEETQNLNLFDIIHPDSQAHCREMFQRITSGEIIEGIQAKFVSRDGEVIEVEGNANCRFIDGKPAATRSVFRNITRRKQDEEALRAGSEQVAASEKLLQQQYSALAEKDDAIGSLNRDLEKRVDERTVELRQANEKLKESEERFRVLYESSRDAIMTLEPPSWRFTSGNPATVQMFRARDEAEFTSREPWVLSPEFQPDGRESGGKAKEMIETAMQNGTHYFEWTHKRLNGEDFPATVLLSRVERAGRVFLQATVRDITGQKRAEEQIHKAALHWESTFDATQDAICIFDADQRIVRCNRTMQEMAGAKNADELVGRHCWDVVHGTKEPFPGCPFVRARGSLKREIMELQIGDRWYVVTVDPILDEARTLVGAVHNIRDITERKQAEESLHVFKDLVEHSSDAIGMSTPEGRHYYQNEAFDRLFGDVGENPPETVYVDPAIGKEVFDTIMSGGSWQGEVKMFGKDRAILDISLKAYAIKDPEGRVIGLVGQHTDISERKQAEDALRSSENYLKTIFNSVQTGLVIIDPKTHTIVDVNPAAEKMTGMDRGMMIGSLCHRYICPAEVGKCPVTDLGQKVDNSERVLITADGSRAILKTAVPVFFSGKEFLLESFIDITERKQAEDRVRSALDEKVVLLREVHHRVKNNLQIIISLLNLQSRYIGDEKSRQALRESQNRVRAMSHVHEKLYQSPDITKIDLDHYIRFLGDSLFQFYGLNGKGIVLTTHIQDISVDINTAIPVGLIVNELISNSLKHAFPDGKNKKITIAIQRQDGMLAIGYTDNGVGIPADFDWRNAKSLGLRLVCSLVDQLDGTIDLDRSAGTAFTIVVKEKE